jgi:hypothetical protein
MVSKSILRSGVSLFSSATNLLLSRIISPFLINQVVDSRISECEVEGRSLQESQLYTGHVIQAPETVAYPARLNKLMRTRQVHRVLQKIQTEFFVRGMVAFLPTL